MTWIAYVGIAIGILFIFGIIGNYIESIPKRRLEAKKKKERWGEFINEQISDTYWSLGRTMMMEAEKGKAKSSIPFLESMGFRFLGYCNEVILWVEPPAGWKKVSDFGDLTTDIVDETGKVRFQYFYKNDIMNPSDYRAEIIRLN